MTGLAGIGSPFDGLIFQLVSISVLIYACSRVFAGAAVKTESCSPSRRDYDRIVIGMLGLVTMTVSKIYEFCYIYLLRGYTSDITISTFSRNCAFLFFIAALINIRNETKNHPSSRLSNAVLRGSDTLIISILSVISVLFTLYAVVSDNITMLLFSSSALLLIVLVLAVILLQKGCRHIKAFAASIIALSLLEATNRLFIYYHVDGSLLNMVLALYPVVYLFICYSLLAVNCLANNKGAVNENG
jgi:hypothetical protein